MSRRSLTLILCTTLSLVLLCCAFVRHGKLVELRNQRARSEQQAAEARPLENSKMPVPSPAPMAAPTETPRPVSSELLKLRNQVSQLTRRRDELATAGQENERLKEQLAGRGTNKAASSGFIRKAEVRFSGYNTPENTVQTFLWAIRTKDYETLLNTLVPDVREAIRKVEQRPGFSLDKIFEGADAIPGLAIVNPDALKQPPVVDAATAAAKEGQELSVQIQMAPDMPAQELVFRLVGGQWKMEWPGIGH